MTLVDSATETAMDVYRELAAKGLERTDPAPPEHRFMVTGPSASFEMLAQRFLGPVVKSVQTLGG